MAVLPLWLTLLASPPQAGALQADPAVDLPLTLATGSVWAALYLGPHRQGPAAILETRAPRGIDALHVDRIEDSPAMVSDVLLYGSLAAGGVVAAGAGNRGPVFDRLLLYAQALSINGAATELTKWAVRRPRPYTLGGHWGEKDDALSFFSGHASFVAVAAFTTARAYDLSAPPNRLGRIAHYGGATALTLGTSALRVAAGKHFPSDVLVGSLVGGSIGWLVPELHRADRRPFSATLAPHPGGLAVQGRW